MCEGENKYGNNQAIVNLYGECAQDYFLSMMFAELQNSWELYSKSSVSIFIFPIFRYIFCLRKDIDMDHIDDTGCKKKHVSQDKL